MKKLTLLAAIIPSVVMAETINRTVIVENPLNRNRVDVPVVVEVDKLKCPFEVKSAVVKVGGEEIPSQLDDLNRDNVNEEVAFVLNIGALQKLSVTLTLTDEPAANKYPARTFAQLMVRGRKNPERIEDISVDSSVKSYSLLHGHGIMFESELNGYRIYFDPKQTLDPYGKFNKRLELEASCFYPDERQLADGFGDDVLMVGQSCGVGALKGWDGQKTTHVEPVRRRSQHLLASGPVRAVVEVRDDGWDYDGTQLNLSQIYTQWAGHRDVEIKNRFSKPLASQTFAAGVMNVMGNETLHHYGPRGTVASWGRHWPVNDTIKYAKERVGLATYVPQPFAADSVADSNGFYYTVKAPGEKCFTYYTMFTSGKETFGYDTPQQWFALLPRWKDEIDNPLIVRYE